MATFEHHRYPALELQGDGDTRPYAKFTPEKRTFGEHTIHVGVLDTDDESTISRLRAAIAAGGDEHLKEIGAPAADGDEGDEGDGDEVVTLESLSRDELVEIAEDEGAEFDRRWGVDKLAAAIREHRG